MKRPAQRRTAPLAQVALVLGSVVFLGAVLAAAEFILGLAGYGPPHHLFLKQKELGTQVYHLNREISELFFPAWATKPPAYQHFPAHKGATTYRVMATGASSTLGDPFGPQTAFPALLGEMLADAAPDRQYEMINCAVIAISSLDVLRIHKEALHYDPDAILIYCGHNEAYGADGVDTPVQRSFGSRSAAKSWLWFRNLRLVRLARGALGRTHPPQEGFGMWTMRNRLVPAGSPKHERLLRFYRANILEMLGSARAKGVDVILCTLISNIRDQSPLGSAHGAALTEDGRARWETAFARGVSAMGSGRWAEAQQAFTACNTLDPDYAESHFRLGRCLDALGDSAAAGVQYVAARDLDAVHFRACSAQNEVLREIARTWDPQGRHRLIFVDLERELSKDYPRGPARTFFTEHVHPYPVGHAWIARAIAHAVAASPLATRLGACDITRLRTDDEYLRVVGQSDLDTVVGLILTDQYKLAKWPFTNCYDNAQQRAFVQEDIRTRSARLNPVELGLLRAIPTDKTGELFDFGKRRYYLFLEYLGQRRGPEALREIELAQRYWWPAAFLETDYAQLLVGLGRIDEAEVHLDRARQLDASYAPIHFVAGAILHSRGRLPEAAAEFEAYLQAEPTGRHAVAANRGLQAVRAALRGGR